MNDYELTYIIHPSADEEGVSAVTERVSQWITGLNGEVLDTESWGRRSLAYPIRKQTEGSYIHLKMRMPPHSVAEFERNLKLNEDVLRYLIVHAGL